jgi:hypothetical protein
MKQTIFTNWDDKTINMVPSSTPTADIINQNLKQIHTIAVNEYISSCSPNPLLNTIAPPINTSEETLSRKTRRILAQLRAGNDYSPILYSYMHKINPQTQPSPNCPLCKTQIHNTSHLFSCPNIATNLSPRNLWDDPVAVAGLLQLWDDALGAAGGGAGSSLR